MAVATQSIYSTMQNQSTSYSVLLCFSHLRWNFVFQRPQHLLTRASQTHEVLFFEEPVYEPVSEAYLRVTRPSPAIRVLTPILPHKTDAVQAIEMQRMLLDETLADRVVDELVVWYYTPMALSFSDHIKGDVCVYDCMDELSAFKNAPAGLVEMEGQLLKHADIVFTGGVSIYEAKRRLHSSINPFPSSVDVNHFLEARKPGRDAADQRDIPHPRVGFVGVIDERLDLKLIEETARHMSDVQFVMIGPVVKIDPADLPRLPNIHWLGSKLYSELPTYLRHWDAGWMPFALNEATRFISPTKTPEFLAAGLPVVSTAIVDVVRTYGAKELVKIVDHEDAAEKLRIILQSPRDQLLQKADSYLSKTSWDRTWKEMLKLLRKPTPVHLQDSSNLGV